MPEQGDDECEDAEIEGEQEALQADKRIAEQETGECENGLGHRRVNGGYVRVIDALVEAGVLVTKFLDTRVRQV